MTDEVIYYRFRFRGGTSADLATVNEVPLSREGIVETNTGLMKIGDGVKRYNELPYFGGGVSSVNTRTGAVVIPDYVQKATAPVAADYGRALINGDRWGAPGDVFYTWRDGQFRADAAAQLYRKIPVRLSNGTASAIPLNADGTIPVRLSNGTLSNIQAQA